MRVCGIDRQGAFSSPAAKNHLTCFGDPGFLDVREALLQHVEREADGAGYVTCNVLSCRTTYLLMKEDCMSLSSHQNRSGDLIYLMVVAGVVSVTRQDARNGRLSSPLSS